MVIFRKTIADVSQQSLARFLSRVVRLAGLPGQVTVLVTGSRELHDLNLRFRGQDKPTDVLSFPAVEGSADGGSGDIAISAEVAKASAAQLGHSLTEELKILILHGVLHLAGYDHETDGGEMERHEARLRQELRLPETLIRRARSRAAPPSRTVRRRAAPKAVSGQRRK